MKYDQKILMGPTYNNIGTVYKGISQYDSAIYYYRKAGEINQELGLRGKLAQNFNNIGAVNGDRGFSDSAEYYYNKALTIYEEIDDRLNAVLTNRNMGQIYYKRTNYSQALEYYLKSLRIAREIDVKAEIGKTLNLIGNVYEVQEELSKAQEVYMESIQISQESGEWQWIADVRANMGSVYQRQNNYDSAKVAFEDALQIYQGLENLYGKALMMTKLASLLVDVKKYEEAIDFCDKSLEISRKLGLQSIIANALVIKGSIAFSQNRLNEALEFTLQGTTLAAEIRAVEIEGYGRTLLAKIYKEQGNYRLAYENQVIVAALSDSINAEEGIKKLARLESQYEFEKEKDSIRFANKAEKMILEQKISRQTTNQWIIGLALVFVVVLLGLLYWLYLIRVRSNRKLKVLNERILERNVEIIQQHDQLDQLNKSLVAINEDKNKILAIVAHDLRNPLQVIKGFISMVKVKKGSVLGEEEEFLDFALQGTERLNATISELLDVSALESRKIDVRPEEINVTTLIDQLAINFMVYAREKKQTIVKDIKGSNLRIQADKNYLIRVLENLISNALKFSKPNTSVTIGSFHDGDSIFINVTDHGPGISAEDQKKLFNEFAQLKARPTGDEKSTGLGLSIVKKYVEAMGGTITCRSKLGVGTKFVIEFKALD